MRIFRCNPLRKLRYRCSSCFCIHTTVIVFVVLWSPPFTMIYDTIVKERYEVLSAYFQSPGSTVNTPRLLKRASTAPYSPLRTSKVRSYIQGTSMRGKEVRHFWSHQDCFSQTGRWVLDETPRALCCKVEVYHTANFTRCDYALHFCNPKSGAVVVYGSPLPTSLAAQIQHWTKNRSRKAFTDFRGLYQLPAFYHVLKFLEIRTLHNTVSVSRGRI